MVVPYKDDEEEESNGQQTSSLLPNVAESKPIARVKQRSCWKQVILCTAILAMCVGVFELSFHGREAESLRVAKEKIAKLEQELGGRLKGGYNRVMAKISRPSTPASFGESESDQASTDFETIKSKSVVVLKTGASVLFDRLPIQLLHAQNALHPQIHLSGQPTYLGPQFLIYSDADMQLGPFAVRDALSNVSSFVRNEKDFSERYNKLHDLLSSGDDLRASGFEEGWGLDKWKFLYMWEDAYRRNPHAEWYVGYEADTYVLWQSLFKFLATQDPAREQLFGCPSILIRNQELFANGGCPYVISGALMRATYGKDPHFATKFDHEVKVSCCGDAELSIALRKSATTPVRQLSEAGHRFQGERPREILFDSDNWCQPVLSFHHLKPEEVQWLSKIESDIRQNKSNDQTVLYADVFDRILPHSLATALEEASTGGNQSNAVVLNPTQEHWEAFSSNDRGVERGKRAGEAQECKKQCLDSTECTAWFWIKVTDEDADGDCYLLDGAVKIGKPYEGAGSRTSGWVGERITRFKAHNVCKDPPAA